MASNPTIADAQETPMPSDIDAILAATEGHTPGPWGFRDATNPTGCDFALHHAEFGGIAPMVWVESVSNHHYAQVFFKSSADEALAAAAPALRAEVLRLRERLAAVEGELEAALWLAVEASGIEGERCGSERLRLNGDGTLSWVKEYDNGTETVHTARSASELCSKYDGGPFHDPAALSAFRSTNAEAAKGGGE